MKRRRWTTWLVYALCVLLVVDVLGWATWRVVSLERAERVASARADAGRRERLALWQMDSLVSSLVARESARPYFVYRARYAADRPYDRAWELEGAHSVMRSPLAGGAEHPLVRLHYQIGPAGELTSPRLEIAAETAETPAAPETLRTKRMLRELGFARGEPGTDATAATRGADPGSGLAEQDAVTRRETPADRSGADATRQSASKADRELPDEFEQPVAEGGTGPSDATLRQQLFDIARLNVVPHTPQPTPGRVDVGVLRPRWLQTEDGEAELVFEREVVLDGERHVQGVWVDWPALRAELLALAVRLVPGASLEPIHGVGVARAGALATIPVRLISPEPPGAGSVPMPTRLTLGVTWAAALTALAAIGFVLHATTGLADRRGRFVATVTHELRSPLTSFRLYTDLLRSGGDDPAARKRYVDALSREASRLASVVESVLAYAGLAKQRPGVEQTTVAGLLEPLLPVLLERAQSRGARLDVQIGPAIKDAPVRTAKGAVERILENLIDNACRYGVTPGQAGAEVTLSARRVPAGVRIRVSDRGPGVAPRERERIFSAFTRGERARDDRGIGLGLSLARGLARAERGELRLARNHDHGAAFDLVLPTQDRKTPNTDAPKTG